MNNENLVVFARNLPEHLAAQSQMVEWANNKITEADAQLAETSENLEHARKQKWKLSGWQNQQRIAQKKLEFYEKIHAALEAGYVIVPDFPIDVFAIRTNRAIPIPHRVETSGWDRTNRTQHSESPALGEGEHFDSEPIVYESKRQDDEGKTLTTEWADEFRDIDFPIKAVKPIILEETNKALALKIFDEIGINPGRPGWSPNRLENRRGVDPMVIGRVIYKNSGGSKSVSFLIAWWLKAEDLTV